MGLNKCVGRLTASRLIVAQLNRGSSPRPHPKKSKKRSTEAILTPKVVNQGVSLPPEAKALETKIREEFGGEMWFNLAKKECCNFDVKFKLGYCVSLFSPCTGFRKKCSECDIGQSLKKRIDKSNNKHK